MLQVDNAIPSPWKKKRLNNFCSSKSVSPWSLFVSLQWALLSFMWISKLTEENWKIFVSPFFIIFFMKLLVIKISLSARASGCFNDQRSFFHLRVNGFISAFPAISSNVHIISSILATQVSLSLHLSRSFLPSFLYLQLCSVVWQGCHKNIIIKYLVVSWVLSCKATWLNMRSFFPDWDFFPPLLPYLFFCGFGRLWLKVWWYAVCVPLLTPPTYLLSTRFICKRYREW